MEIDHKSYAEAYSPKAVMTVLNRTFSKAGLEVVTRVLQLYYLAQSKDMPTWAKAGVFAALGYFVITPDAIPDITPVLGFVDDLAVLTSTLSGLAAYLTPEVRSKASDRLQKLLGNPLAEEETR